MSKEKKSSKVEKQGKPVIGNKEAKKVEAKEKRTRTAVTPPPTALAYCGGIVNPMLNKRNMKRPLCVALAMCIKDDEKLCEAVRATGIVRKAGLVADLNGATLLSSELSGRGYALRTGRAFQAEYPKKFPAKIEAVMPFAKAVAKALADGTLGAEAKASEKKFVKTQDELKAEFEAAAVKKAKKAKKDKSGKEGKPVLKKKDKPAPAEEEAADEDDDAEADAEDTDTEAEEAEADDDAEEAEADDDADEADEDEDADEADEDEDADEDADEDEDEE
jgi:hypothetical protein